MKKNIFVIILFGFFGVVSCSEPRVNEVEVKSEKEVQSTKFDKSHQAVYDKLKANDSLIFELGFNQCDTNQLKLLTSSDFEFYHDQSGITDSKTTFIQSIAGLCQLSYRPIRMLEKNSLEVHILRENGEIYGAIQHGKHSFYAKEESKPVYLTSTADFTHLWIIEDEIWKLKRVLSYNHRTPDNE